VFDWLAWAGMPLLADAGITPFCWENVSLSTDGLSEEAM